MVKPRKLKMELRKTAKERSISFTKRRQGLFSKAANFSVITDAQIALWVTSPCANGKTYSFTSHHSIDEILDAFLQGRVPEPVNDAAKISAMSLWHEVNTLESNNSRPRKASNENNESATQRSHWNLEEFENCNSVEVLKDIVYRLESMRSGLITRMKRRPTSRALPLYSYPVKALPLNSCPASTIVDVCSVQPVGLLNHDVGTKIVAAESITSGINYDTMPSSSMPAFGFYQNVSDMNYNVHNNAMDIPLPSGFNPEDNVGGWSNNNPNVAFDQMQNQEFFHGQCCQNTELKNKDEDEKQVFAAFDSGLDCVKNDFMDNKFNDVEDGAGVMGSTWNTNLWNSGTNQYDYGNDESLWQNFDGDFMGNLPAVPFEFDEKPINDEWFCLQPLQ